MKLSIKNLNLKNVDYKKISWRKPALIAAIIILLVVNVFLIKGYFGEASTKADLESDIAAKERTINSMKGLYNVGALEGHLAQLEQQLAEEAPFPQTIDDLDVAYSIIETAREARITCFNFYPDPSGTTEISGHKYVAKSYDLDLSAGEKLSRLIKFIRYIEELPYNTLLIDNIILSSASEVWVMNFDMEILTQ